MLRACDCCVMDGGRDEYGVDEPCGEDGRDSTSSVMERTECCGCCVMGGGSSSEEGKFEGHMSALCV